MAGADLINGSLGSMARRTDNAAAPAGSKPGTSGSPPAPAGRRAARVQLYAVLTLHGWVAWAALQDGPVDWRGWAAERADRAAARLADPALPTRLATAAR